MQHWHLVHTLPGQELMALQHLQAQGHACVLPRLGGPAGAEPVFARLVWVAVPQGASQGLHWAALCGTPGVSRLVHAGRGTLQCGADWPQLLGALQQWLHTGQQPTATPIHPAWPALQAMAALPLGSERTAALLQWLCQSQHGAATATTPATQVAALQLAS